MRAILAGSVVVSLLLVSTVSFAATLTVGAGKTYPKPCAAFAAAADGDTIEIDAGSYDGDVCAIGKNNLTIKGVGGRAKVDAAGKNSGGKAIWVVQGHDTTIENVELSGCTVPDMNGAGVRQEGANLTVRNSSFHDNENGILTGADATSTILIENSEFGNNGAGDGYSHNMYIGEIKSFTLRGCYSHHGKSGHLVKSRALENHILYNRLTDEDGHASYEIDLPQGGKSYVVGNAIQQSAATENPAFISFARESKRNPGTELWVVGNTFFNGKGSGTFVAVAADVGAKVTLRDNIFAGGGTVSDDAMAILDGNYVGDAQFVNAAAYDFHLKTGSPAVDKGVSPGTGGGESLTPACQYVHPTHAVVRTLVGTIDQGGFELGGESTTACGGTVSPPGDGGTTDSGTTADSGTSEDSGSSPIDDAGGTTSETGP
ncbi:MAG: right-handed parallel beta-helix repeat-containing protein, partial [Polyangiales bacterium]